MQIPVRNDFWSDKRVVVTGATGFIGWWVVDYLGYLGATIGTCSLTQPSDCQCDLSTPTGTAKFQLFLESDPPDVVIHLAAQPIVDYAAERLNETIETNIMGAVNVLSACRSVKSIQSILFVSTDKVYGNTPVITNRSIPMGVEHPYNASKLAGDILAQMFAYTFNLPITIIRHGNVYGAHDRHLERIIPKTCKLAWEGKSPIIRGDGKALRDYIHAHDIARAYAKIIETEWGKVGSIYNLGAKSPTSVQEVVDTVLKVTQHIELAPVFTEQLQGEIPNQHIVDPASAEKIDWKPLVDLEEGIALTAPYYKEITWTPR